MKSLVPFKITFNWLNVKQHKYIKKIYNIFFVIDLNIEFT